MALFHWSQSGAGPLFAEIGKVTCGALGTEPRGQSPTSESSHRLWSSVDDQLGAGGSRFDAPVYSKSRRWPAGFGAGAQADAPANPSSSGRRSPRQRSPRLHSCRHAGDTPKRRSTFPPPLVPVHSGVVAGFAAPPAWAQGEFNRSRLWQENAVTRRGVCRRVRGRVRSGRRWR